MRGPERSVGVELGGALRTRRCGPIGPRLRCRIGAAVLLGAAMLVSGCTEETITGVGDEPLPGFSPETVELDIGVGTLPAWRDTTFEGFVLPQALSYMLAADHPTFQSRVLGRFPTVPDSVQVGEVRRAVTRFDSASIRIILDTLRSEHPAAPISISVHALERRFGEAATWTAASSAVPWATPGGDLGLLLGQRTLAPVADTVAAPDTLLVRLTVPPDSLLKEWRESGGENGIAITVEGDGAELFISNLALRARVRLEGVQARETVLRSPDPGTFIFFPPFPDPARGLRLGGVPGARIYVEFEPPERVGEVPLRGSGINRAFLLFEPAPIPAEPFAFEVEVGTTVFPLLADPFEIGPKVPIGATLSTGALDPDSLAAGKPMTLDVTGLMRDWADADPDSLRTLRVGVAAVPEGGEFGMWEFGSIDSAPELRPVLRVIVTPPAGFDVP